VGIKVFGNLLVVSANAGYCFCKYDRRWYQLFT